MNCHLWPAGTIWRECVRLEDRILVACRRRRWCTPRPLRRCSRPSPRLAPRCISPRSSSNLRRPLRRQAQLLAHRSNARRRRPSNTSVDPPCPVAARDANATDDADGEHRTHRTVVVGGDWSSTRTAQPRQVSVASVSWFGSACSMPILEPPSSQPTGRTSHPQVPRPRRAVPENRLATASVRSS